MNPVLKLFLQQLATMYRLERTAMDREPYLEIFRNLSYIYRGLDEEKMVEYFNEQINK